MAWRALAVASRSATSTQRRTTCSVPRSAAASSSASKGAGRRRRAAGRGRAHHVTHPPGPARRRSREPVEHVADAVCGRASATRTSRAESSPPAASAASEVTVTSSRTWSNLRPVPAASAAGTAQTSTVSPTARSAGRPAESTASGSRSGVLPLVLTADEATSSPAATSRAATAPGGRARRPAGSARPGAVGEVDPGDVHVVGGDGRSRVEVGVRRPDRDRVVGAREQGRPDEHREETSRTPSHRRGSRQRRRCSRWAGGEVPARSPARSRSGPWPGRVTSRCESDTSNILSTRPGRCEAFSTGRDARRQTSYPA